MINLFCGGLIYALMKLVELFSTCDNVDKYKEINSFD